MAVETLDESRQSDRKRVLKGGKIAYAARCASLPCVVRDLSSTGARLQVKDHASIPETFELLIELDGFEADVEVVWRSAGEVGVIFIDEPVVKNPKRKQVVSSSVPRSRGTLRKLRSTAERGGRSDAAMISSDREAHPAPEFEQLTATNELVSTEEQVEALTASLGTLEIVSGETVQSQPASETSAADLPAADLPIADHESSDQELVDHEVTNQLTAPHIEPRQPALFDLHDRNDETMMDHTYSHQLQDEAEECIVEPSQVHAEQDFCGVATLQGPAARTEAPVFRDQIEGSLFDVPVHDHEVETASPSVTEAMQARISTALQAPTRAAENLVRHVAPIIPAPEHTTLNTDTLHEPLIETPTKTFAEDVAEAEASFLPVEQSDVPCATIVEQRDITIEAPVQSMPESAWGCAAPELKTASPSLISEDDLEPSSVEESPAEIELRPDLAAFVQMFSNATSQDDNHAQEEVVAKSDVGDFPPTECSVDVSAELEVAPQSEDLVQSNIVEFPPTSMAPLDPAHAIPNIEIVEESIVCVPEVTEQVTANFCEMHFAEPPIAEAVAVTSASDTSTVFEELLPCADEDEYVAPAASELPDVMMEPERCFDQSFNQASIQSVVESVVAEDVTPQPPTNALATTMPPTTMPVIAEVFMPAMVEPAPPVEQPAVEVVEAASSIPAKAPAQNIPILIAEDDQDDRLFMREAFADSEYEHDLAFVENGEELLDYLNSAGADADRPRPGLILLDLNMPKMDGRTALLHIKANPSLRRIPVIVLTTSNSDDDIEKTYDLGVSSYISKPSSAEGLKDVITTLNGYWSSLVALPNRH